MTDLESRLYRQAFLLSLFTILYNVGEGVISMVIGYADETLSLFGFGADSFIEVISGVGVGVMVMRIRKNPESPRSTFEKAALRVTGTSFYLLTAGLLLGIILNVIHHQKPETTPSSKAENDVLGRCDIPGFCPGDDMAHACQETCREETEF